MAEEQCKHNGSTSPSHTDACNHAADSGSTFRIVVTNTTGTVTSSAATLTVNAAAVAPTITTATGEPDGDRLARPPPSAGPPQAPPPHYQWQRNSVAISGAISSLFFFDSRNKKLATPFS